MLRVIVGTLLLCSLVSLGDSLKCFNTVSLDGSLHVGRASTKSSDCKLLLASGFVKTKYGYIPESIAKQANLTGEVVRFKVEEETEFLCIRLGIDESGDLGGTGGNIDIDLRFCTVTQDIEFPNGETVNISAVCSLIDKGTEGHCRTCDTDECNSSSSLTASLFVCLIFALFTKMW